MDKLEEDEDGLQLWVFENLRIKQTVFQISLLLFSTFDMILWRHICLTKGCDFVLYNSLLCRDLFVS